MDTIKSFIEDLRLNSILGDARLNRRMPELVRGIFENFGKPLSQIAATENERVALYAFLANNNVNPAHIILSDRHRCIEEIKRTQPDTILVLHDTTELDYTGSRSAKDLGCLNYTNQKGYYLHSAVVCDTDGICMGVYDQRLHTRTVENLGKSKKRRYLPICEKESQRWVASFKEVIADLSGLQPEVTRVINVADSEGDFFELLQLGNLPNAHYIIRQKFDRKLAKPESEQTIKAALAKAPVLGKTSIRVCDPDTQKEREVELSLRATTVTINIPYRKDSKQNPLQPVTLNVVEAFENNPPENTTPICWCLLTSLPVGNLEEALIVCNYYKLRWQKENFHLTLKEGGRLEYAKLNAKSLPNVIALYSIAAVQVLRLRQLNAKKPDAPVTEARFETEDFELLEKIVESEKKKHLPPQN